MRTEANNTRSDDDAVDSTMVGNHLNDRVAIARNRDVTFATGRAKRVRTATFELRSDLAAQSAGSAGDEKKFAVEFHTPIVAEAVCERVTVRDYFGW